MKNDRPINNDINAEEIIILEPKIYDKLIEGMSKNDKKIINDIINDMNNKEQNKSYINKKKDIIYIKEDKNRKKEYFNNFKILKISEFNSLYIYLNKKEFYYTNKLVFENHNDIIIQIYKNHYELCHCDKDKVYSCKFLFYFYEDKEQKDQEDKPLKNLLYYESFNTYLNLEKYERKDISENIILLTKD